MFFHIYPLWTILLNTYIKLNTCGLKFLRKFILVECDSLLRYKGNLSLVEEHFVMKNNIPICYDELYFQSYQV